MPEGTGRPASLAAAAADIVWPVHAAIPGRARLHLPGLRRAPALKSLLERGLPALPGVQSASASTETGNLLVQFDPALPLSRILERVAALVRGEVLPPPAESAPAAAPRWYARSVAAVAAAFGTCPEAGLPAPAARARLAEAGVNAFPPPAIRSPLGILVGQFNTLPVGLLAAASVVSLCTGAAIEAAAILGVVALNGVLGFTVESRSERTIGHLGLAGEQTARVIRGGATQDIPLEQVVPGDLILLRRGMVVPADARLVAAHGLSVSEALLTGESLPVEKDPAPLPDLGLPLGDRSNMVYRGTAVTGGSGSAIVTATGPHTAVGRIQRLVGSTARPDTPMERQLDELGRQLFWLSLGVCGAVLGIGLLRGFALFQMFRSGVSLAVAAIPEGLPTVATTTLALGIEDMRRHDVLVRRLDAVETLASVRVVCFDKTGTLTLNRMAVAALDCGGRRLQVREGGAIHEEDGRAVDARADPLLSRLLEIGALCSETQIEPGEGGEPALNGSATENALVRLALDAGQDVAALRLERPRLSIRHRSESYRFMVTTHREAGTERVLAAVKGSPEEVLDLCASEATPDGPRPLTPERRAAIAQANAGMARAALRVLGFACREAEGAGAPPLRELTWLGLAGMADPVRPGAAALMRTLHDAGIHTIMMTGDQASTARAVARQLGLAGAGQVAMVDAAELDAMPPERLAERARQAHVFARISPAEKLRIIRALQQAGLVVAMIGDGINDSPALRAADVGIAMGRDGAQAAREVADVVLRTDELARLAVAVERGRATHANVRKAIRYLLATNLSEILVVLCATAAGMAGALSPMQLLWINLISDILPGLGLAFEAPEPELMRQPPRPADAAVVGREDLPVLATEGAVIAAGSLAACGWGVLRHGISAEARSMTFGSLVTAQLLHALTCRSRRHGPFLGGAGRLPPNRMLAGALGFSFLLQGVAMLVPGLRGLLGVVPIGPLDLAVTAAAGTLPYLANEALKGAREAGGAAI